MKDPGEYNRDEALRIVCVRAMLEGHTYTFEVNSSNGQYLVAMIKHEYPQGFFQEKAKCCQLTQDPCGETSVNLKDALWDSIQQHRRLAHRLTVL